MSMHWLFIIQVLKYTSFRISGKKILIRVVLSHHRIRQWPFLTPILLLSIGFDIINYYSEFISFRLVLNKTVSS